MFKRTAVYVRGKRRFRRPAFAAFLAAALAIALLQALLSTTPAQATSVNDCPGGAHSGEGSSSCPNLYNNDLLNQRSFPRELYRGDSRLPYEIFTNGFRSRGPNDDIVSHVQGDRQENSNYISTTGTLGVAEPFARSQGLRNLASVAAQPRCSTGRVALYAFIPVLGNFLMESCENGQVTAESFVYVIDPAWGRNALYVPDQIRGNAALYNHYVSQDEWAYVHQIPREAITGVRIYRMTAHATRGVIDTRTITFRYDRFAANPHHAEARIAYNPGADPNGHFTFEQSLEVPSIQAHPYVGACSAVYLCRQG